LKLNYRKGSAFASQNAKDYLKDLNPEDIKSITVIRYAAIGDFMNIRPFLIGVREYFPNAKIVLNINNSSVYGAPEDLVDEITVMQKYDLNNKRKKTGFFHRFKQIKSMPSSDILFDLTDSTFSMLVTFFSRSKLKVGYPYRSFRRNFYDIVTLRSDFVLETESTIQMLNMLGYAKTRELNYGFEEKYPKKDLKRIVYFAGASVKNKCWEESKFTDLIEKMSSKYTSYNHVILQGIKDDEKFLDIYKELENKENVSLQTSMDLDEAMQYLSDSRCLVSNDTGVRNMAIALETPTIGIFFAIAPFRYWPRDIKHDCVFNVNYTSPNVDDVYKSADNLISKLYL